MSGESAAEQRRSASAVASLTSATGDWRRGQPRRHPGQQGVIRAAGRRARSPQLASGDQADGLMVSLGACRAAKIPRETSPPLLPGGACLPLHPPHTRCPRRDQADRAGCHRVRAPAPEAVAEEAGARSSSGCRPAGCRRRGMRNVAIPRRPPDRGCQQHRGPLRRRTSSSKKNARARDRDRGGVVEDTSDGGARARGRARHAYSATSTAGGRPVEGNASRCRRSATRRRQTRRRPAERRQWAADIPAALGSSGRRRPRAAAPHDAAADRAETVTRERGAGCSPAAANQREI